MEALGGNNRQSSLPSIVERQQVDRINTDPSYSSSATMAATAVASPTHSLYSNGPPPPYTSANWGQSSAPRSTSGLISPPDSRWTSDNKSEASQIPPPPVSRQSLPSIHEAVGLHDRTNPPYQSPVSASLPSQSPFAQPGANPRTYPPSDNPVFRRAHSPPRPVHPLQSPYSRPEYNAYSEPPRHPSLTSHQLAPGPPNPFNIPRYESRFEPDVRLPERPSNAYAHPPPQPEQGSYHYGPTGPPPSRPPASGYGPQTFSSPQYPTRDGQDPRGWKEAAPAPSSELAFKTTLKRSLEGYDYENSLAKIISEASELHEWAKQWSRIAQEISPLQTVPPGRMPDAHSCADMLQRAKETKDTLEKMYQIAREHEMGQLADAQARRGHRGYEEDPYDHDQGRSESKKRRGRAAPPGRCHSCNRAETPEWRRGPDGARTLCNACGLHYAKLTRKQQNNLKQNQGSNIGTTPDLVAGSNLRPKSIDNSDSRPQGQ